MSNLFDEKYDIRLARYDEIDEIMKFINDEWQNDHIMATNKELFIHEFVNENRVNVIIAKDRETELIQAILCFIVSSERKDKFDIWGCIWKAVTGNGNYPLLGIEIAKRLKTLVSYRYQLGVGNNPKTSLQIRNLVFGCKSVQLKQYYFLNNRMNTYSIAAINDMWKPETQVNSDTLVIRLDSIDDVRSRFDVGSIDAIPYKDNWYIEHHYFNQLGRKYEVWGLLDSDANVGALVIGRSTQYKNSYAYRIVDYIGNHELFAGTYNFWSDLVYKCNYEYVDFYEYGLDDEILEKAGFRNRQYDNNIIPNYFEPFEKRNIDIYGFIPNETATIYKGDGDQDRPNLL